MRGHLDHTSKKERRDRLVARQHGLLTLAQARSLGVSDRQLRRSPTGTWVRVCTGVFRHTAYPRCWRQDLMAAVLMNGRGAVASHRAAAALHGMEGVHAGLLEVTVPGRNVTRRRSIPFRVDAHRTGSLAPRDVEVVDGIPVTTPTRTLLDLGAVVDAGSLELALESGLRRGRTSLRYLVRRLGEIGRRGRRGTASIRSLLARHAGAPTESELETRFLQLLRRSGLPPGIGQFEVHHGGRLVARVDRAFPDKGVLVELDGYGHHGTPADHRRDLRRQNQLQLAMPGHVLLRFGWADVVATPALTLAQLSRALGVSAGRIRRRRPGARPGGGRPPAGSSAPAERLGGNPARGRSGRLGSALATPGHTPVGHREPERDGREPHVNQPEGERVGPVAGHVADQHSPDPQGPQRGCA